MLKDLLIFLARSLVDNPDKVVVTESDNGQVVSFKLHVADEDMGKCSLLCEMFPNARIINTIISLKYAESSSFEKGSFAQTSPIDFATFEDILSS